MLSGKAPFGRLAAILIGVCSLATPPAGASTISSRFVSTTSSIFATVARPNGDTAGAALVATQSESEGGHLTVRLCPSTNECTNYEHTLLIGEYLLGSDNNIGRIDAEVDGLGHVFARVLSARSPSHGTGCIDTQTTSSLLVVGQEVAGAVAGFDTAIGPWVVIGGGCGINGLEALTVWTAA